VSVGREEDVDLMISTGWAADGMFVGWLEVVLTTLSRPWADADCVKQTAANKTHTKRATIFLKSIKCKTPIF